MQHIQKSISNMMENSNFAQNSDPLAYLCRKANDCRRSTTYLGYRPWNVKFDEDNLSDVYEVLGFESLIIVEEVYRQSRGSLKMARNLPWHSKFIAERKGLDVDQATISQVTQL